MKLVRALFLLMAVLLPTSWAFAHGDDMKEGGDKSAETKKAKGKKNKKEGDDMGDMKKGDSEKK